MLGEVIEGSLTETEEECVHTHAKNTEEATGNDISSQDGGHDRQPVIVEVGALKVFTQP